MKRLRLLFMWIVLLVLLGSCEGQKEYGPHSEQWLCSINADGTGFRKIMKDPFTSTEAINMYMTPDDKIIIYGKRLWITDTDVIAPIPITPSDIELWRQPTRLSQSPDGSKLFFAANTEIYQLSYLDYQLTKLTNEQVRLFRNPIVSEHGNYITYSSTGYGYPSKYTDYLYLMNLQTGESSIIHTSDSANDSIAVNAYYSETEDFVYYENYGLHKSRIDGTSHSVVDNSGDSFYPNSCFNFSFDKRFVLRGFSRSFEPLLRIYDLTTDTAIELPVKEDMLSGPVAQLCMNANKVFFLQLDESVYPEREKICVCDLDTFTNTTIFESDDFLIVYGVNLMAPTWDGTKVYFRASLTNK